MLLAVIVPKRGVSETIATKHCYWNAWIPVAAIWVWFSHFRSVVGTPESFALVLDASPWVVTKTGVLLMEGPWQRVG